MGLVNFKSHIFVEDGTLFRGSFSYLLTKTMTSEAGDIRSPAFFFTALQV